MSSEQLTAREAADRIGVSVRTLGRYVAAGIITPARTPGGQRRFDPADVDRLLAEGVSRGPSTFRPDGHPLDPWQ